MSVFTKFIRPEIEEIRDAAMRRDDPAHKMIVRLCSALLVEYNIAEENELRMDHIHEELEGQIIGYKKMKTGYYEYRRIIAQAREELTHSAAGEPSARIQIVVDLLNNALLGLSKEQTEDVYNCAIERSDEIVKAACGEIDKPNEIPSQFSNTECVRCNGEGEILVGCALCGKIKLKIRPGMPGSEK